LIERGLHDARRAMSNGIRMAGMDQQLLRGREIVSSIHALQSNYENVRQFYRTLFGVVTEHNSKLAHEIAEILGEIQTQDVVRQRVERVSEAVTRRNHILEALPGLLAEQGAGLAELPEQMRLAFDDYVSTEDRHVAVGVSGDSASPELPKFELF
jgi:methyl-accepting chemotaxis protein